MSIVRTLFGTLRGRTRCGRYFRLVLLFLIVVHVVLILENTSRSISSRKDPLTTQLTSLVEEHGVIPTSRNVTPSQVRLLIYNRVPKCGSTTTFKLLNTIRKLNKFHHKSSYVYHTEWLSEYDRIHLLKGLYKFTSRYPRSYDRHMFYFNATRLGFERPAWINIVREPVSRFISEFYFARNRDNWDKVGTRMLKERPPDSWFNMELDECAAAGHPECRPSSGNNMTLQLSFFCGHQPECRQVGSRWALNQAKYHIENYYSVVGVLEELSLSFRVLQEYLPRFFRNVESLHLGTGNVVLNERSKEYKPQVSNTTKEVLRSCLKEDLELYQFARQRLHLQAQALGLLTDT